MRWITAILGLFASLSACACSDASSTAAWSWRFNASSFAGVRVGTDGSGRLGFTGAYEGPLVYDGQWIHHHGRDRGSFLSVFDSGGGRRWLRQLNGTGTEDIGGVVADARGHWLLTGDFDGTFTLGAGASLQALSRDMFLADFDPDGNLVWSKHFSSDMGGPSGVGIATPSAGLAVTPRGDIVAGGSLTGTFGFGGSPLHPDAPPADPGSGTSYGFVVELDAQGAHRWSLVMDGNTSSVNVLAVDQQGDTLIAGRYTGFMKLGDKALAATPGGDGQQAFIGKLGPGGEPLWLVGIAGDEQGEPVSIAADASDNVLIAGTCAVPQASCSPFVIALSPAGELLWQRTFDPGVSVGGMAVDGSGHVLVTGGYSGALDLGAGPLPLFNARSPFLAELDASGHTVKSDGFGDLAPLSAGTAVALMGGKVAVIGSCTGESGACARDPNAPRTGQGRFLLTVER